MARPSPRARGFTLTELIIILVIVGALGVFAAPRLDVTGFDDYSFEQELKSALRYAQKAAVASRCEVEVAFNDGYAVSYTGDPDDGCGDGEQPLGHPTRGGPFAGEGERGAGIVSAPEEIVFDTRGRLDNGHDIDDTVDIELRSGRVLTIWADTGYIDG